MPFDDASTYQVPFEEASGETQLWPVTPYQVCQDCYVNLFQSQCLTLQILPCAMFKIRVSAESHAKKCFASLFVDGQKIDQHFLSPTAVITFDGIPSEGGSTRELLFSLPRFVSRAEKVRTSKE
jgi:hypothetical protein